MAYIHQPILCSVSNAMYIIIILVLSFFPTDIYLLFVVCICVLVFRSECSERGGG